MSLSEPDRDVDIPTYKELFDLARDTGLWMEQLAVAVGANTDGGELIQ